MQFTKVNERRSEILTDFMMLIRQKNNSLWDELVRDYNQSQARLMNTAVTKAKKEKMFVYNSLISTLTIAEDYRYAEEFKEAHERSEIRYDEYIMEVKQMATEYESLLRE